MSKHIADKQGDRSDASRLESYTDIERRGGNGQSAREKALFRQKKAPESADRVKRYLDIDRKDG